MEVMTQLNPVTKAFLAGSMSGTCSTLLFQPLDLVKTRQQSLCPTPSMVGVARVIITTDRITALWKGVIPSICRTVPGVGIYFSSMHWMKSRLSPNNSSSTLQSIFIGAAARTIAASTMIPFTVIKTRFESDRFHYRGVINALNSILRSEGSKGLYRGLFPTLVRDVPFSGLYLAFYEALKSFSSPLLSSSPTSSHILSGLGAGVLASLITQPADVVKTRMQLDGSRSQRFLTTVSLMYREEGLKSFSVGLAPRLLRRSAMAALAWTVYEKVINTMSLK